MLLECWIPKATDTTSEYVILIAIPLQQWLHERASLLRYSTLPHLFALHFPGMYTFLFVTVIHYSCPASIN